MRDSGRNCCRARYGAFREFGGLKTDQAPCVLTCIRTAALQLRRQMSGCHKDLRSCTVSQRKAWAPWAPWEWTHFQCSQEHAHPTHCTLGPDEFWYVHFRGGCFGVTSPLFAPVLLIKTCVRYVSTRESIEQMPYARWRVCSADLQCWQGSSRTLFWPDGGSGCSASCSVDNTYLRSAI